VKPYRANNSSGPVFNLRAELSSLRARVRRIEARLVVPAGGRQGRTRGLVTKEERHAKGIPTGKLRDRLTQMTANAACR
jgi:hypothetical protein